MKTRLRLWMLLIAACVLLSACAPILSPNLVATTPPTIIPLPSFTPSPTIKPTATLTSTPIVLLTPTHAPTDPAVDTLFLNCEDQATLDNGAYRVENNTWGKGNLSGWSQCIGLGTDTDGEIISRWTWDWLKSNANVKAYPEIIFGQKPGTQSTSPDLPQRINLLNEVSITYDISSSRAGAGNLAFDIWLTDSQNPDTWGVPPISHEIMIWLDSYGGTRPGGTRFEQTSIDGILYEVYVGDKFGDGWRYMAFARTQPQSGPGALNLVSFLTYLKTKELVTGQEYVASIELGNEVINGAGDTVIHQYEIVVR